MSFQEREMPYVEVNIVLLNCEISAYERLQWQYCVYDDGVTASSQDNYNLK